MDDKPFKMHVTIDFEVLSNLKGYPKNIKTVEDACKYEQKHADPLALLENGDKTIMQIKAIE